MCKYDPWMGTGRDIPTELCGVDSDVIGYHLEHLLQTFFLHLLVPNHVDRVDGQAKGPAVSKLNDGFEGGADGGAEVVFVHTIVVLHVLDESSYLQLIRPVYS
jgi:hypothetical protein